MSRCIEHCKVDDETYIWRPLLRATDRSKSWSWSVYGDRQMKLQVSGRCLFYSIANEDQIPKLLARERQHLSHPCSLTRSPWKCDISWGSLAKAPKGACVNWGKKKGTPGPQKDNEVARSGGRSETLKVRGMSMLTFAVTRVVGCAWGSGVEAGSGTMSFWTGVDGADWERSCRLIAKNIPRWDGALWWIQAVWSPKKESVTVIRWIAVRAWHGTTLPCKSLTNDKSNAQWLYPEMFKERLGYHNGLIKQYNLLPSSGLSS